MDKSKTKKVALVGIDGAGKSTIMRRFLELAPIPKEKVSALTCPQYHDTKNIPLSDLSGAMDAFSRAADGLGSFELKAAAMVLQMTLFGPIEDFILENYRPEILISERHPIVDSLAYAPFYSSMIKSTPDPISSKKALEPIINDTYENAFADILHWQSMQNQRLNQDLSVWDLAEAMRDLFAESPDTIIAELQRQYRTSLPDVVLLLEPGLDVAMERIRARSSTEEKELHEQAESLGHLQKSYHHTLQMLHQYAPFIQTHIIKTGDGDDIDTTLNKVINFLDLS